MRYMLNVEVKLIEIEDDEIDSIGETAVPSSIGGEGPMAAIQSLGKTALKLMAPPRVMAMPFAPPAGVDFRRTVSVNVQGFGALAEILGKYEALTREIQLHQV